MTAKQVLKQRKERDNGIVNYKPNWESLDQPGWVRDAQLSKTVSRTVTAFKWVVAAVPRVLLGVKKRLRRSKPDPFLQEADNHMEYIFKIGKKGK